MNAKEFGRAVSSAVQREDGSALAILLDLHSNTVLEACAVSRSGTDIKALAIAKPWKDILAHFFAAGMEYARANSSKTNDTRQWKLATDAIEQTLSVFLRYFTQLSPGRWSLPALFTLLRDAQTIAQDADNAESAAASSKVMPVQKHTEACARQLNKAFSACIADRYPSLAQSKKWGTFTIVGRIFQLYFRLGSTALCKNVLRALNAADLPPVDAFPRSDRVTFQYYVGRLAFLDEDYLKAETFLSAALADAPNSARHNVERILLYLIPMRLLHGVRPTSSLLESYPRLFALYRPIIDACWAGDVRQYDALLAEPQLEYTLVHLGLYLALERAREICMTRLFRRVWIISGKSTRLHLKLFSHAMNWVQNASEPAETEWSLATLIAKGRIKGYIAHDRQMMVLSAKDAFPRASLAMIS
ncbi:COP9 signalosome (CSN) subunit [Malassezia yamatoensis]|uniref:COP9 signalosome (CSN) subunit n=1 Tax=Malassezia yamatoensis TaxID=253288 RepID=A0AAJ5YWA3_9BASI|nr:COP9 signalosome (CSN) subunit [Malassezia yamatoensis]